MYSELRSCIYFNQTNNGQIGGVGGTGDSEVGRKHASILKWWIPFTSRYLHRLTYLRKLWDFVWHSTTLQGL
jgi:hypothetical protein